MDEENLENPSLMSKIKSFLVQCKRVLKVTKKPTMMEFKTVVKVSGLGMAVIGFIGFIVLIIKELFF